MLDECWGAYKRQRMLQAYRARRDRYAGLASERGLCFSEQDVVEQVRSRLSARGYSPAMRSLGEVHTFAFIPRLGWHGALLPDLEQLGPVTQFDYTEHGYDWPNLPRWDDQAVRSRREMLDSAFAALCEAHRRRPVDWVFVYASGGEVSREFLQRIVDELGLPVVNMCLDDKQSWEGAVFGEQRTGQVDIASSFDVCWTSARVACEWYLCEDARPVYMPEGFDPEVYRPLPVVRDIPVSFIGGAYGFRPSTIRFLKRHDVPVEVFGGGWGTRSVWGQEQIEIINRSRINLGAGGIGYSEELTNVKTRDFEIPGAGGGLYVTSFNPDLAQHFDIGREMKNIHSDTHKSLVSLEICIHIYISRVGAERTRAHRPEALTQTH